MSPRIQVGPPLIKVLMPGGEVVGAVPRPQGQPPEAVDLRLRAEELTMAQLIEVGGVRGSPQTLTFEVQTVLVDGGWSIERVLVAPEGADRSTVKRIIGLIEPVPRGQSRIHYQPYGRP